MEKEAKILIVDDEPALFSSLAAVLRRFGYDVSVASCSTDAFQTLKVCRFDLILLDLKLKETTGLQLLPMFRRMYPHIPVVILTGDDSNESTLQAIRLGARGYLLKPIDPQQIAVCIGEVLKQDQLARMKLVRLPRTRRRGELEDEIY